MSGLGWPDAAQEGLARRHFGLSQPVHDLDGQRVVVADRGQLLRQGLIVEGAGTGMLPAGVGRLHVDDPFAVETDLGQRRPFFFEVIGVNGDLHGIAIDRPGVFHCLVERVESFHL